MQAPQPGWMTLHARLLEDARGSRCRARSPRPPREPNWMKKSTPSATRRPASQRLLHHLRRTCRGRPPCRRCTSRRRRCRSHVAELGDERAVGRIGGDAAVGVARGAPPSGRIATRSIVCTPPAYSAPAVGRARPRARSASTSSAAAAARRSSSSVASSTSHDARLGRALGGHVGERRALVGRERREAGAAELHHAVERLLLLARGWPGCRASRPWR